MDYVNGVQSALLELGLGLVGSSVLDSLFWPISKEDDELNTLLLRLIAQGAVNGVVLTLISKLGLEKLKSPTGLIIFAVLFIAGQEKFLVRFKAMDLRMEKWLANTLTKESTPAPATNEGAASS